MKILSGSYSCATYEGEIYIDNILKRFNSPVDSEENGIEMIYQEISLHLDLSIAENIFLGRVPSSRVVVRWKKLYEVGQRRESRNGRI